MVSRSDKREREKEAIHRKTPSATDPHPAVHGVLLSDEITFYAQHHGLIEPFDPRNLKPAGYELTIGDEYFLSGEFRDLDSSSPEAERRQITIPPFQVAVLKTAEMICLPQYMIARWNIRVRHAYAGLLWVGGPQVDPGYVGFLFCPIYNLSDKAVTLGIGEPIALMDFVKTTPFNPGKSKEYPFPPKRIALEEFQIDDLRSALFTQAAQRLDEVHETVSNLEARFVTFTTISFAIFGLVIALVALITKSSGNELSLSAGFMGAATVALSIAALLVALLSYVRGRIGRLVYEQYGNVLGARAKEALRYLRRAWRISLAGSLVAVVLLGFGLYRTIAPSFDDLRQESLIMRSGVDSEAVALSKELELLRSNLEKLQKAQWDSEMALNGLKMEIHGLKPRSDVPGLR